MVTFSSDRTSRDSTRQNTMEDQPKSERKDRLEQLRKMESNLKDEEPSTNPAMTVKERKAARLRAIRCNLAYLKLTFLELEDKAKEDEACADKEKTEEIRAELARSRQTYADLEESVRFLEAQFERAVQRQSTYPVVMQTLT